VGRSTRARPKQLGGKLRQIRVTLGLTQLEMIKALGMKGARLHPSNISEFESNRREPSLLVLLRYARIAGVSTDVLIDDKLNVPK